MGLLSGTASVTRFAVGQRPPEPDFERWAFEEIQPGAEVRERVGFVPFEPGAVYRIGHERWAFRVRCDVVRPDGGAVRERLAQLVATEKEQTGADSVGPKKRKKLRELAEAEIMARTAPRTRMTECVLDGDVLWVGSTSNTALSTVMSLARATGIEPRWKTPWLDRGEEDLESELLPTHGPAQSVLGCRFLKALVGRDDILFEPEKGNVTLVTPQARVALRGEVLPDLSRYMQGECELLTARLLWDDLQLRLDALGFRVNGAVIEIERASTWVERLEARLERIAALYAFLDETYAAVSPGLRGL
ncbi:MAG: hypothetical protein MUF10_14085 [Thermoanaerobaculaceae bacterium]|jgi:hypothetical protein|nr:hypothetical protein [Thermoanaerobaculaceae bacterium]